MIKNYGKAFGINTFVGYDLASFNGKDEVSGSIPDVGSMKKYQKVFDDFAQQFEAPYWTPHENLARLTEEVGELAREINADFGPKKKKLGEKENTIADELADIVFTVIAIANSLNIDMDEAMNRTSKKYTERDSNRYKRRDNSFNRSGDIVRES